MRQTNTLFITLFLTFFFISCAKQSLDPLSSNPTTSTATTPPSSTTPPSTITPPATTRPEFLPKFFDEKSSCLISKIIIETNASGINTKTTNIYTYDSNNRFTQIKSTTVGLVGEAILSYSYKDTEKKIEVTYKGFNATENYSSEALLNSDFTIKEINTNSNEETSKTTYTYNANGELVSQKFDSNLKSYFVDYTYGAKGIIRSERKNYVGKASPAPANESMLLEWSYGDATSACYSSLALSDPNFPTGYLGKPSINLPMQSKINTSAKITSPVVYEYNSNSITNYNYITTANKITKIETDSNANSSGVTINVKTKIDLEYK